jgi:hypothetical protein
MNESEWKRYLIRSIRAQGGVGHRVEDKFKVGWPDLIFIPRMGPVFFIEAKIIKGAKLACTELQQVRLEELWRPPHALSAIIGFKPGFSQFYIGQDGDKLNDCLALDRPLRLDSDEWSITNLLHAFDKLERYGINQSDLTTEPSR